MKLRKWKILDKLKTPVSPAGRQNLKLKTEELIDLLLENRGISSKKDKEDFLHPSNPYELTAKDVGIHKKSLTKAIERIQTAIKNQEKIVVYADYDADGVTAGAIMWETLYQLGADVVPYIPHRVDEGYGFSITGINNVKKIHDPKLIISVDHGVTAREKIAYAQKQGLEVIVTDHHVLPDKLPQCLLVHTTKLSGAGVAWFIAKELMSSQFAVRSAQLHQKNWQDELLALAAIGTIGDMMPLVGSNRSLAKSGLEVLNRTARVGLKALFENAGIKPGKIGTYEVSFMIVPRLNAMGRIVHALDALRLLCTPNTRRAKELAEKLGATNRERQQLTIDTTFHAKEYLSTKNNNIKKLLFISHAEYNQGVIGLVAGKLVESFYRPTIVVAKGKEYSKASARSINGFNIIAAIRSCSDLLVDCGGHPMAAGFTVQTQKLEILKQRLEKMAATTLTDDMLIRTLKIDCEIPLTAVNLSLTADLKILEPFGMANPEPLFLSRQVVIDDLRVVGTGGKHLKLKLKTQSIRSPQDKNSKLKTEIWEAIGFGLGQFSSQLKAGQLVDIVYTIDTNVWNGNTTLQLKVRDFDV